MLAHGNHVLLAQVCLALMEGSVWEKDPPVLQVTAPCAVLGVHLGPQEVGMLL